MNLNIPENVTSIGKGAFNCCTGLTTIQFNSATTTIGDSENTIPTTTKIIGYDSSTAKDYAVKYNRTFEAIEKQTLLTGDVDGNGQVQAFDALMTLQIATGKKQGTLDELTAADVDESGNVTAYDALRILQYATGKITSF